MDIALSLTEPAPVLVHTDLSAFILTNYCDLSKRGFDSLISEGKPDLLGTFWKYVF